MNTFLEKILSVRLYTAQLPQLCKGGWFYHKLWYYKNYQFGYVGIYWKDYPYIKISKKL